MTLKLCWRCQRNETAKRIDGVPVCRDCMLADARENKGILPDYSLLTPPVPKKPTTPKKGGGSKRGETSKKSLK